jgi:hypothetical protein
MTSVAAAIRPIEATTPGYRRFLTSGVVSIAAVGGVIAGWSFLMMASFSVTAGLIGLVFAAGLVMLDARFATPTRIEVTDAGITLGYWKRDKTFAPGALVVTHDVPRGRFTVRRQGGKRALAMFRDQDAQLARIFVRAGVEIISK